jgi:hypothetical protein
MRTTTTRRRIFRRKHSRKARKHTRKTRSRRHRGGQNIGANCSDPNYSIFNTNFLKLFPYKA